MHFSTNKINHLNQWILTGSPNGRRGEESRSSSENKKCARTGRASSPDHLWERISLALSLTQPVKYLFPFNASWHVFKDINESPHTTPNERLNSVIEHLIHLTLHCCSVVGLGFIRRALAQNCLSHPYLHIASLVHSSGLSLNQSLLVYSPNANCLCSGFKQQAENRRAFLHFEGIVLPIPLRFLHLPELHF